MWPSRFREGKVYFAIVMSPHHGDREGGIYVAILVSSHFRDLETARVM